MLISKNYTNGIGTVIEFPKGIRCVAATIKDKNGVCPEIADEQILVAADRINEWSTFDGAIVNRQMFNILLERAGVGCLQTREMLVELLKGKVYDGIVRANKVLVSACEIQFELEILQKNANEKNYPRFALIAPLPNDCGDIRFAEIGSDTSAEVITVAWADGMIQSITSTVAKSPNIARCEVFGTGFFIIPDNIGIMLSRLSFDSDDGLPEELTPEMRLRLGDTIFRKSNPKEYSRNSLVFEKLEKVAHIKPTPKPFREMFAAISTGEVYRDIVTCEYIIVTLHEIMFKIKLLSRPRKIIKPLDANQMLMVPLKNTNGIMTVKQAKYRCVFDAVDFIWQKGTVTQVIEHEME